MARRTSQGMRLAAALSLALAATPAAAQDIAQAKTFVEGLYAQYAREPGPDWTGKQAGQTFSPALLALIRADEARTPPGDVGTLDGDPFCNCQDYRISRVAVTVAPTATGKATANVRFANFDQPQAVTLDLVWTGKAWRVDDIHADGTPSLAALLREAPK